MLHKAVLVVAVLLSCLLSKTVATPSAGVGGPYIMIPLNFGECDDLGTNEMRLSEATIRKKGKSTYLCSIDFILPYGLSDNLGIGVEAYMFNRGMWQKVHSSHFKGLCRTFKTWTPTMITSLIKTLSGNDDCPVSPGNYTLKNEVIKNARIEALAIAPYGKYMIDTYFTRNSEKIGCKKFKFDLVPKM